MPARIVLKGRSKYGNRKVTIDGYTFDSVKESERYLSLKDMQENGEILGLEVHPEFPLLVNDVLVCKYVADFSYRKWKGTEYVVEDVKGFRTKEYRLKAKLFRAIKGFKITEI